MRAYVSRSLPPASLARQIDIARKPGNQPGWPPAPESPTRPAPLPGLHLQLSKRRRAIAPPRFPLLAIPAGPDAASYPRRSAVAVTGAAAASNATSEPPLPISLAATSRIALQPRSEIALDQRTVGHRNEHGDLVSLRRFERLPIQI
jgi:hypothetical protein